MDQAHRDHPEIPHAQQLSAEELALLQDIKDMRLALGQLVERVQCLPSADGRAAAIAKAELQGGMMWLIRAIAKPLHF